MEGFGLGAKGRDRILETECANIVLYGRYMFD